MINLDKAKIIAKQATVKKITGIEGVENRYRVQFTDQPQSTIEVDGKDAKSARAAAEKWLQQDESVAQLVASWMDLDKIEG